MELKTGDLVFSKYFGSWVEIASVKSDSNWTFEYQGHILKARTKLSYFIKNKLFRKKEIEPKIPS